MIKYDHSSEMFISGIRLLISSHDTIQERLSLAYELEIHRITPEELPEEIRDRFIELDEKLSSAKPIDKMETKTAEKIADDVFLLYVDFTRYYYKSRGFL